jgi:hypothetical protein
MRLGALIGGIAALAGIAGAAVVFLWQGITWLASSTWTKLSLATALRWLSARSWARLAHGWPDGYALLDAVPLSLALLGVAVICYAVAKWGADR